MSIASEITRLQNAKAALKSSIEAKGVTVPSEDTLDDYPSLVESIPTGGGDPEPGQIKIDGSVITVESGSATTQSVTLPMSDLVVNSVNMSITRIAGVTPSILSVETRGSVTLALALPASDNEFTWINKSTSIVAFGGIVGILKSVSGLDKLTSIACNSKSVFLFTLDQEFNGEITFPELTEITGTPSVTIFGIKGMTKINIPKYQGNSLPAYMFASSSLVTTRNINLGNAVITSIGNYVFNNCSSLKEIHFDDVTEITSASFNGVYSTLETLSLPSLENWKGGTSDFSAMVSLNLPKLSSLTNNLSFRYSNVTSIDFPLLKISNGKSLTLSNCTSLVSVNLPEHDANGYIYTRNCTSLTTINAPKALTVPDWEGCSALTELYFPEATSRSENIWPGSVAANAYPNLRVIYWPKVQINISNSSQSEFKEAGFPNLKKIIYSTQSPNPYSFYGLYTKSSALEVLGVPGLVDTSGNCNWNYLGIGTQTTSVRKVTYYPDLLNKSPFPASNEFLPSGTQSTPTPWQIVDLRSYVINLNADPQYRSISNYGRFAYLILGTLSVLNGASQTPNASLTQLANLVVMDATEPVDGGSDWYKFMNDPSSTHVIYTPNSSADWSDTLNILNDGGNYTYGTWTQVKAWPTILEEGNYNPVRIELPEWSE